MDGTSEREPSSNAPTIVHLGDRPDAIPAVAAWLFGEWGHKRPGGSLERAVERLEARVGTDILPLALIAVADGRPVGTASLVDREDAGDAPGPWVSGVYVVPEVRGRGVGRRLIQRIEVEAARLGFTRLLLSAATPRFHESLGYVATGDRKDGEPVMAKSFKVPPVAKRGASARPHRTEGAP